MTLLGPSESFCATAEGAALRRGYAARSELAMRHALEAFCRQRWSDARIVHELVMGARQVRADVVAIGPEHIVAFEVKGVSDDTTRLLHQVGMFQLCVPEVWMVVPAGMQGDAELIHHLLPSVGVLSGTNMDRYWGRGDGDDEPVTLSVVAEAVPRATVPEMTLEMLWAEELRAACHRLRVSAGPRTTRPVMIKGVAGLAARDVLRETCTALRGRDALWRADQPIRAVPATMGMR